MDAAGPESISLKDGPTHDLYTLSYKNNNDLTDEMFILTLISVLSE